VSKKLERKNMDIGFIYPASDARAEIVSGSLAITFAGFPNQGKGIRVGLSLDTAKRLHESLGKIIEDCNEKPSLLPKH
jgi:hypothetical protein